MHNQCDLRFQRKTSQCFSGYAGRACAELLGFAAKLLWVSWSDQIMSLLDACRLERISLEFGFERVV